MVTQAFLDGLRRSLESVDREPEAIDFSNQDSLFRYAAWKYVEHLEQSLREHKQRMKNLEIVLRYYTDMAAKGDAPLYECPYCGASDWHNRGSVMGIHVDHLQTCFLYEVERARAELSVTSE